MKVVLIGTSGSGVRTLWRRYIIQSFKQLDYWEDGNRREFFVFTGPRLQPFLSLHLRQLPQEGGSDGPGGLS